MPLLPPSPTSWQGERVDGFVNCDLLGPPLETHPAPGPSRGAHGCLFVMKRLETCRPGPRSCAAHLGRQNRGLGKVTREGPAEPEGGSPLLGPTGAGDWPGATWSPGTAKFQGKPSPSATSHPQLVHTAPGGHLSPGARPPVLWPGLASTHTLATPIHFPLQRGNKPGYVLVGRVVLLSKVPQPREAHDKNHQCQGAPRSCQVARAGRVTRGWDPTQHPSPTT